ncbi:MAG: aminoacyl-tRNA hydrolase [Alphaproteobacteria bacterium]|nr:aminoacyl-tRNA hydrolase [Alphaproteobacteria bacterium]
MKLIVGLGNPGAEYALNRHNIGFMAVDVIMDHFNFPAFKAKFKGLMSEKSVNSEKIILFKPQTYMNESGRAVAEIAQFYKIPLADITVIHDELDIPAGQIKTKIGGGAAGHNGLKSIDAWLGDQNYHRIRLGIGHPGHRDRVTGHVLGNFSKEDQEWLPDLLATIPKIIFNS